MFTKGLSDLKKLLYNKNMIIAFAVLAILGFTFGYFLTEMLGEKHEYDQMKLQENPHENSVLEGEDPSNAVLKDLPSKETVIKENTILTFKREYIKSNEIDDETKTPEESMIGLNKNEFEQLYKQWEITKFDEEEIILHTKIDSYSPRFYKIGMAEKNQQQYIAVFNFDKEGKEVLDHITSTPISILNENEKKKFEEGVVFGDIEEVHRMLENYDG